MEAKSSSIPPPKTSSDTSIAQYDRVEFSSFDAIIEEQLELKQHLSHRLINTSDKPNLVWALREWLIRQIGCFDVVGYVRYPDINYWYDNEALIEEFDDLLLLFRDYLRLQKALVPGELYRLVRYQDNLNFILLPQSACPPEDLTAPGYGSYMKFCSELWPELQKEFVQFQTHLEVKYGHRIDITALFNAHFWEGNSLAWEASKQAYTEE